jgi:hypothetical protein
MRDLSGAHWRKSTRSGGDGGNCVEVATNLEDVVAVRDTKDRTAGTLLFAPAEWAMFIEDVKDGEFDV